MNLSSNESELQRNEKGDEILDEFELPSFDTTYDIIPILLCVLIIASNSLMLYLVYRKRNLRTVSNLILSSLSLSDALTGLCGIPLYLVCSGTYQNGVCISSAIFTRFTSISTVMHLTLVTIDRLVGVMKPLHYHATVTEHRAAIMIGTSWTTSVFCSLIQLVWVAPSTVVTEDGEEGVIQKDNIYTIVCLVVFFILPLILMIFSYVVIFLEVLEQRRKITKLNMPFCQKTTRRNKFSREWKPAMLFMTMALIFTVSWLPYFVLSFLHNSESLHLPEWVEYIFIYLRFLTSFTNPLLYVFGKQDFREEIGRMQRARDAGRGSRNMSTDIELNCTQPVVSHKQLVVLA